MKFELKKHDMKGLYKTYQQRQEFPNCLSRMKEKDWKATIPKKGKDTINTARNMHILKTLIFFKAFMSVFLLANFWKDGVYSSLNVTVISKSNENVWSKW